ncbi:MAG: hypothetical protein KGP28_02450 [Bdellovibrionales bacterium]|nr:hypothetical protein [Bdellovibrionales bacterium]
MMKRNSWIAALVLVFGVCSWSGEASAVVRPADLNSSELERVQQVISTEIRADLSANLEENLLKVSKESGGGDPTWGGLLKGDPMSPETRDVISSGLYQVLFSAMREKGVYLSEAKFKAAVGKVLEYSTRLGIYPSALTVGYMGRLQAVVGGSVGNQFNVYFDRGKLKASGYSMFGAHVGYAEMSKIQFYVSFCFGTCFGGDASGWYVGLDACGSMGIGGDFFVEAGVDVTDLVKASMIGLPYSVKDLYQSKAIYLGMGFDVGQGVGVSGDVFYYTHDFDLMLMDSRQKPSSSTFQKLRLR